MALLLFSLFVVLLVTGILFSYGGYKAIQPPKNCPKNFRKTSHNGKVVLACIGDSLTHGHVSHSYVDDLAAAVTQLVKTHAYGIYHLVNEGQASRYEFAQEILRVSGRSHIPMEPITSDKFERASTPPPYAPLANNAAAALNIQLRPWQQALDEFLDATGYKK